VIRISLSFHFGDVTAIAFFALAIFSRVNEPQQSNLSKIEQSVATNLKLVSRRQRIALKSQLLLAQNVAELPMTANELITMAYLVSLSANCIRIIKRNQNQIFSLIKH